MRKKRQYGNRPINLRYGKEQKDVDKENEKDTIPVLTSVKGCATHKDADQPTAI